MNTRWIWIIGAIVGLALFGIVIGAGAFALLRNGDLPDTGGLTPPPGNTPIALPATVEGQLWHDLCAWRDGDPVDQGAPAGCVANAGGFQGDGLRGADPGIGGVLVSLGSGSCPSSGLATTLTDGNGAFRFSGLAAGNYCVSIDAGSAVNSSIMLPGAWTSVWGAAGSGMAAVGVSVGEGGTSQMLTFAWDYRDLPLPPTATATQVPPSPTAPLVTPTRTPAPIPCDLAQFVADINVPDGTLFTPGKKFTKTWRLKNIGSCTWTADYSLAFATGDKLSGPSTQKLGKSVKPGEVIDVSVELVAPDSPGNYKGYWNLRNTSGVAFGISTYADKSFWVAIEVRNPGKIVYDFTDHVCEAAWSSGAGGLACPGTDGDSNGYVIRLDTPHLEGNRLENEPGIWVHPQSVDEGYISGAFPAFRVRDGDHFRAVVACQHDSPGCDVRFVLSYRIGDGAIQTPDKWNWVEAYEGRFTKIDVDLSSLKGKDVTFILTVRARTSYEADEAIWLHPAIYR